MKTMMLYSLLSSYVAFPAQLRCTMLIFLDSGLYSPRLSNPTPMNAAPSIMFYQRVKITFADKQCTVGEDGVTKHKSDVESRLSEVETLVNQENKREEMSVGQ